MANIIFFNPSCWQRPRVVRGWYVFWCFTTRLSAKPLSQSVGGFNVTCIFNWGVHTSILDRVCEELLLGNELHSLKLTAKAPKNGWLEYYSPIGEAYFQGRTVSFRESTLVEKKGQLPPKVTGFMGGPSFSHTFFLVPLKRLHLRMQWWCETRLHFLLSLSELVINSNWK